MPVAVEEEEEGIAPELDEPAAQRVGNRQQALETCPQDFGDFLGSDLSGGHVIYVAAHEPRVKALVSQVSSVDSRPYKPYQPEPARTIAEANAAAAAAASSDAAAASPDARRRSASAAS